MTEEARFDKAAALLPETLRGEALFLGLGVKQQAEEIRLRCGLGAVVVTDRETLRMQSTVGRQEIEETLERASRSSMHTVQESLRAGFLTAPGGYRIGVGGSAVIKHGENSGFRQISSLCIRIPREKRCVSPALYRALRDKSLLVLSPPGGGKTTFLRELVRLLSDEGQRVGLIDERSELAALENGRPQLQVGANTDVIELCPKPLAVDILLRAMSPQVLAMDELSGEADAQAVSRAAGCGVRVLASVHVGDRQALRHKQIPRGVFDAAVLIRHGEAGRQYELEDCTAW